MVALPTSLTTAILKTQFKNVPLEGYSVFLEKVYGGPSKSTLKVTSKKTQNYEKAFGRAF